MSDKPEVEFSPLEMLAIPSGPALTNPRVFGAPLRYVQGEGVITKAGHYFDYLGYRQVAVLLTRRSMEAEGRQLLDSLQSAGINTRVLTFGGECCLEEIDRHVDVLREPGQAVDVVVAVGGGKAVDTGKAIAHRLELPSVVVPSLASNDAPCAAASVIYTADGVTLDVEIYKENPVLVLMDSAVVVEAGERFLAAGMGDAMATWYEARACAANPAGITAFGGRPTLAGAAIAKLCAETLFDQGVKALRAVRESRVTESLEKIVEANTLLSGLGYESGGLAAAHAYAQGFTVLEDVHRTYMHGEMVAIGTLAQLMLEDALAEAQRVAQFFVAVGLPVHLGQIGLDRSDTHSLDAVIQATMAFPFLANMPVAIDETFLREALLAADQLGLEITGSEGEKAYLSLHS